MDRRTADRCLALLADARDSIHTLDITGGAPELSPHFRWVPADLRAVSAAVWAAVSDGLENGHFSSQINVDYIASLLHVMDVLTWPSMPCRHCQFPFTAACTAGSLVCIPKRSSCMLPLQVCRGRRQGAWRRCHRPLQLDRSAHVHRCSMRSRWGEEVHDICIPCLLMSDRRRRMHMGYCRVAACWCCVFM